MFDIGSINFNELSLDDVKALEAKIKEVKPLIKEMAKAKKEQEKAEKTASLKVSLSEGCTVLFLYGRDNVEHTGTVVRFSEKTVTVKSDAFDNEKGTNYVRYDRIVKVL